MSYEVIKPGEGIEYKWSSDHIFVKSIGALADGRASMVEDTLKPGFHLGRHHHKKMTEIYLVLEGEGVIELNGDRIPVKPMSTVLIPPRCRHRAVGDLKVSVIAIPTFDEADEWFD